MVRGTRKQEKQRWLIVGPGAIARRFAADLAGRTDSTVAAVVSRNQQRARMFCVHSAPDAKAYESVDAALDDGGLDAAYIATPHPAHVDPSLRCLAAGVAVLCEKPLAHTSVAVESMLAASTAHQTLLMEALWSLFLPSWLQAATWIRVGAIGRLRQIDVDFGFAATPDPTHRLFAPAAAGGALLDIGVYPLALADALLDTPLIAEDLQQATATEDNQGIDHTFSAAFHRPDGIEVRFRCSITEQTPCLATMEGDRGRIVLGPRFHESPVVRLERRESAAEVIDLPLEGYGLGYQVGHFLTCLANRQRESRVVPHADTLRRSRLLETIRDRWQTGESDGR